MEKRSFSLPLGAALFLLSGTAALVYQVIWQRILGIFSGLHIYSVTLIVTAFMAGLGFGSLYGGRLADRLSRPAAVLAFAGFEAVIGGFALLSPWLYYDVAYLRLGFLVRYPLALPAVHFLLLLLPTFLMGASLPLLSRALVWRTEGAARTIGLLYGFNTLGAGLGALISAWVLIGALGFAGTIRVGAALNFLVALGALLIHRQVRRSGIPEEGEAARAGAKETAGVAGSDGVPAFALRHWCLIYGLGGFVALSLELMWFRVLDVAIKSSPYTFGHLLALFLGFLALGSLCGIVWVPRLRRPDLAFLWGQWGISATAGAALLLVSYGGLGALGLGELTTYWGEQVGLEMVDVMRSLAGQGEGPVLRRFFQAYVVLPVILLALPTFLMGFTFTCVHRAVQTDLSQVGFRVGAIQTANIVGSILGSLVTGTLFLGVLGTAQTASLLIAAGAVFPLLAMARVRDRSRILMLLPVAVSVVLALAVPHPDRFWRVFHGAAEGTPLVVDEDASGVATIQELGPAFASMRVNGKMHSMLPYGDEHSLLGLLPTLLHPSPRRVLVIGLGSGNTAWAAAASPAVEELDVYEIVAPEITVLRTRQGTNAAVGRLLGDPRVRLRFSDGRLALRTGERRYDVIEADALEPSMSYSGSLYSREFFQLGRSRLAPGGFVCTYVPTERTRRTVAGVFPHLLDFHSPNFASFIIAGNEPLEFDPELIRRRLASPPVQQYLRSSGELERTTRLVEGFLENVSVVVIDESNRGQFIDGDVNTDLFPRDEFDKTYDGTYK